MSPKSATLPFSGISIVTTGRWLPTTTVTVSTAVSPDASVTVSVTSYVPAAVNVCDGFAAVDVGVPSSKSHK